MKYPESAIPGLCTASATVFSVGTAFIGLWAFGGGNSEARWLPVHFWVLGPALIAFVLLACVPFLATDSAQPDRSLGRARIFYVVGALLVLVATSFTVILSFVQQH